MGYALSSSGRPWAPQAPGHGTGLRASGTTKRSAREGGS
jgi:hypothetical protein